MEAALIGCNKIQKKKSSGGGGRPMLMISRNDSRGKNLANSVSYGSSPRLNLETYADSPSPGPTLRGNAPPQFSLNSNPLAELQFGDRRHNQGPRVTLNVSGLRYETYLTTLNRFPNTLLGNPLRRLEYYDEEYNDYFFERNRASFDAILNFYQTGLLRRPMEVPLDVFVDEIKFFDLGQDTLLKFREDEGYIEEAEDSPMPTGKLSKKLWLLFEHPESSILARIVALISVFIILLSIVVFCVETLPEFQSFKISEERTLLPNSSLLYQVLPAETTMDYDPFFLIETVCIIWFSFELAVRFASSPSKALFFRNFLNLIDLVAILPYFVTLITMLAGSKGITHKLDEQFVKHQDVKKSSFRSIPEAFWWAVITMTTVGYGDLKPVGLWGKLVGGLCAITGVLTIALPVPVIVSNFNYFYRRETDIDEQQILRALDPINQDEDEDNEEKELAQDHNFHSKIKICNLSRTPSLERIVDVDSRNSESKMETVETSEDEEERRDHLNTLSEDSKLLDTTTYSTELNELGEPP